MQFLQYLKYRPGEGGICQTFVLQINRPLLRWDDKKIILIEKKKFKQEQKTVLVGLVTAEQTELQLKDYLDELAFLAETAGVTAVKRFTQKLPHPDSRTFVGKGKLEEIRKYVSLQPDVDLVVFDDELTGSQIQNIEKELGVKIVFMGFGLDSDNLHSPNEKYELVNYYKGIETIPYFHQFFAARP